ncbi:hypothetical protein LMH73_027780 [Vibrio splendidus]|nr:hypothetical protein [Vibrio splendidus]MCC4882523.1 hypothetical protein [Vibrio splendidus]
MSANQKNIHVERSFFTLLEAVMKGYILTVGDTSYRYVRKDCELYEKGDMTYVATETGFFFKCSSFNAQGATDIWLLSGTELSFFESIAGKVTSEELASAVMWLTLDNDRRSTLADRMVSALAVGIERSALDVVTSYLECETTTIEHDDLVYNSIYAELQKDNTFPMGKLEFKKYVTYHLQTIKECIANAIEHLTLKGLVRKEVIADKNYYARASLK